MPYNTKLTWQLKVHKPYLIQHRPKAASLIVVLRNLLCQQLRHE